MSNTKDKSADNLQPKELTREQAQIIIDAAQSAPLQNMLHASVLSEALQVFKNMVETQ